MDVMAFLMIFLLIGTVVLAPWLGTDSRGLDPVHFEPTHPLHKSSSAPLG